MLVRYGGDRRKAADAITMSRREWLNVVVMLLVLGMECWADVTRLPLATSSQGASTLPTENGMSSNGLAFVISVLGFCALLRGAAFQSHVEGKEWFMLKTRLVNSLGRTTTTQQP